MNFYQILTLILIAALPFFPKQLDTRIPYLIIAAGILLLPLFWTRERHRIYKDIPVTLFLVFIIVLTFSTIFSIDRQRSLIQLATYASYFVIFASVGSIFSNALSRQRLALVLLFVTFALSLISLYQTVIVNYVNREVIGVSFMWVYFGHNHLSALLLFSIPVSLYFLITKSKFRIKFSIFWLFTIFYLLFAMYFTFARASMISLAIATLLTFLILGDGILRATKSDSGVEKSQKGSSRWARTIKYSSITAIIALSALAAATIFHRVDPQKFGIRKVEITSPARPIYWQMAIANAKNHPFFGTGLDTFRFVKPKSDQRPLKTFYTHNFFLQMLSDAGILGFLASLALIGSVLGSSFKRLITHHSSLITQEKLLSATFLVGLLASTINSLVDFDWQLPTVFLIFWMLAGVLLDHDR